MISPQNLVLYKLAGKTAVVLATLEIAAYEITPETFNSISVGLGALFVAGSAVVGLILHARSDRKALAQHLLIAHEQMAALKEQGEMLAKTNSNTHEIKVSMDGKLDLIVEQQAIISEAIGVKKGREQVHAEQAAAAIAMEAGVRDEKIVDQMVGAVTERIGEAADAAANTTPGSNKL